MASGHSETNLKCFYMFYVYRLNMKKYTKITDVSTSCFHAIAGGAAECKCTNSPEYPELHQYACMITCGMICVSLKPYSPPKPTQQATKSDCIRVCCEEGGYLYWVFGAQAGKCI